MPKIKINLSKTEYMVGDTVTGTVEVSAEDDFDFTEMYIEYICEEHTRFSTGSGDSRHTHSESFLHHSKRVILMEPGTFTGSTKSFAFSFEILEGLPISFDSSEGWIEHELKAKIGRKWRLDPRDSIQLAVTGKPQTVVPKQESKSLIEDETVLLEVEIENTEICLGEDIKISYRVDDLIKMRGVRFDLESIVVVTARGTRSTTRKNYGSYFVPKEVIIPRSLNRITL